MLIGKPPSSRSSGQHRKSNRPRRTTRTCSITSSVAPSGLWPAGTARRTAPGWANGRTATCRAVMVGNAKKTVKSAVRLHSPSSLPSKRR